MPKVEINGVSIHYEIHGEGAETILFSHGLLWSGKMFEDQITAFKPRYRCISFDFRGQGQTAVTRSGYDLETLYNDTIGIIESLKAAPCHFVGVSMGGMVGLRVAARNPGLIKSLTLLATSADAETVEKKRRYGTLTMVATLFGLRLVADQVMAVMFGKTFLNDPLRAGLKRQWRDRLIGNRRLGIIRAVRGVTNRKAIHDQIGRITAPTLVLMGDEDVAIPREGANRILSQIRGSKLAMVPRAGHTPTVEEPAAVNVLLDEFISKVA